MNGKEEKKITMADFEHAVKEILLSTPSRKVKYENRKPTKEELEKKCGLMLLNKRGSRVIVYNSLKNLVRYYAVTISRKFIILKVVK